MNIYERLEIEDYEDLDDFVRHIHNNYREIKSKYKNSDEYSSIIIFGGFDFIFNTLMRLVNEYGYEGIYLKMDREYGGVYALEFCDNGILVEDIYYVEDIGENGVRYEKRYDKNDKNKPEIKLFHLGYDFCSSYLYQEDVTQDVVDYCLKCFNTATLFGIGN